LATDFCLRCLCGVAGTCKTASAWVYKGDLTSTHNSTALCSGVGTCNTLTGRCECQAGFTGEACDRSTGSLRCAPISFCAVPLCISISLTSAVRERLQRPRRLCFNHGRREIQRARHYDLHAACYEHLWRTILFVLLFSLFSVGDLSPIYPTVGRFSDNFDSSKTFGCVCDFNYFGLDCSQRTNWFHLTVAM
jgi:hypothetical protein